MFFKIRKEEVYNLLVKYRGAFSLRDKTGTCPNIEVNLQVNDKCQFFRRLLHVKDKHKPLINKEKQRLVNLGIFKQNMSPYSSYIILIARKKSSLKTF